MGTGGSSFISVLVKLQKEIENALLQPNSQQTPSLIFQFMGDFRSYEFRITTEDEKTLEEGSHKLIQKLLSMIKQEELPPQAADIRFFRYENENWSEVR